ncbi:hypothetical protein [Synechococcus phage S-B68]|nr:hypothetical protein [Synechococcus phage S-B68]
MDFTRHWFHSASAAAAIEGNSLRFRKSQYLSRTPTVDGNRTTWTYSAWFKKGAFDDYFPVGIAAHVGGSAYDVPLYFAPSGDDYRLLWYFDVGNHRTKSDGQYRDPGAWYHLVAVCDTGNSTSTDRLRVYVNGERISAPAYLGGDPAQNDVGYINNSSYIHRIGWTGNAGQQYLDGLLTDIHFADGQTLDPTAFGEYNSAGVWVPKEVTGVTYGTNGFYLDFSDPANIGADRSGNGNDFTPTGFELTDASSLEYDWVEDHPKKNFATINPLVDTGYGGAYKDANIRSTKTSTSAGYDPYHGTIAIDTNNCNHYVEFSFDTGSSVGDNVGAWDADLNDLNGFNHGAQPGYGVNSAYGISMAKNGDLYHYGTYEGNFGAYTTSDTIGLHCYNGTFRYYKNGQTYGPEFSEPNRNVFFAGTTIYNATGGDTYLNHGQMPFRYPVGQTTPTTAFNTVVYRGTAATQSITGVGFEPDLVWAKVRSTTGNHSLYDSVRGTQERLSSSTTSTEATFTNSLTSFDSDGFSLGSNTDGDVNASTLNYVAWCFNAGDNSDKTYAVTVVADSGNKYRFDGFGTSAVTLDLAEGSTYRFDQSDSSNSGHPLRFSTTSDGTHGAGSEYTTGVTTVGTPGTEGAYTEITVAASAPTLYYYCSVHSGMGGQANTNTTQGASNFDGSITSTVKASDDNGFSVVSYTGNLTSGQSIGHGLSKAPTFMIIKQRSGNANDWAVYHKDLPANNFLKLNTTGSQISDSTVFPSAPSDSVFYVNEGNNVNNAHPTIAYCFADTPGQVKTGSYVGNGSTDGPYIECGFKPAMIMFRRPSSGSWNMVDSTRNSTNPTNERLEAQDPAAEQSGSAYNVDLLSTGFKLRTTDVQWNGSGDTIIYIAFAENFTEGTHTGTDKFNTVTYTGSAGGAGQTQSITGVGFSPDLVWIKRRENANSHVLTDTVRGAAKFLHTNATNAEVTTNTDGNLSSFDSDGFTCTYGSSVGSLTCQNGGTYVAWCFNAGTGSATTNTDGSIQSAVKADADGAFSIVTYTGTGSNASFGHGLGAVPSMCIIKQRNTAQSWWVWHKALGNNVGANNSMLELNGTAGTYAADDVFRGFTSSVVNIGSDSGSNTSGGTYVAYCFADTPGFVKTGSYVGTGSTTRRPFVECGFRPAMVIVKVTAAGGWVMYDDVRGYYNAISPNAAGLEYSGDYIEFTDTGFYADSTNNTANASGLNYVFIAFGRGFDTDAIARDLSTEYLPAVDVVDPSEHFNTVTYTGNGGTQSVTGVGFQPDLTWIKYRSGTSAHGLFDSVRGAGKSLRSDDAAAEQTQTDSLTSFDADGFSLGDNTESGPDVNFNTGSYVAWCWKAGGAAVSNTDGTITSQVSANQTAGFSVVTYTGNGVANATVGTGLGKTASMVIVKNRSSSSNWMVRTTGLRSGANLRLNLDSADEIVTGGSNSGGGIDDLTSSTTFTLLQGASSTFGNVNQSGDDYVAYCWAEVPGYSAFGSYQGNGSTDNAFCYTGFRPAFVLLKVTDVATTHWIMFDSSRDTYNPVQTALHSSYASGEVQSTSYYNDFLSNGFKIRSSNNILGASGATYVWAAFAEHPFGGSNISPAPAR